MLAFNFKSKYISHGLEMLLKLVLVICRIFDMGADVLGSGTRCSSWAAVEEDDTIVALCCVAAITKP